MTDREDQNEIVPIAPGGLMKRGSNLVRRGLDELSSLAEKGRILLVGDTGGILELGEQRLRDAGYDVRSTANASEAIKIAEKFRPDGAMVAFEVSGADGIKLATDISRIRPAAKVQLWVESEELTAEQKKRLHEDGIRFPVLRAAFKEDEFRNAELFRQLKFGVSHSRSIDEQTGLFNEYGLDQQLPREIGRAERNNYDLSILSVDLDLKNTWGPSLNPSQFRQLLRELGDLMKTVTRGRTDTCFYYERYGEILLLLAEAPKEDACLIAKGLHNLIVENSWLKDYGAIVRISPRIAVATFPEDGKTLIDFLHALDEAIYALRNLSMDGVFAANKGLFS